MLYFRLLLVILFVQFSIQDPKKIEGKKVVPKASTSTQAGKLNKVDNIQLSKPKASVNSTTIARVNFDAFKYLSGNGIDSAQLLGPDDQCKMLYGKDASFCRQYLDNVCKHLYCRKSLNEPCVEEPQGAREGTTCDSGKTCFQGECKENKRAPIGDCLFGDDIVKQEAIGMNLPSPQMVCKDVLNHIISISQTPTAYCTNSNFRQICCETCKKYDILTCTDRYFDCPRYKSVCKTATINGLSVMMLCPRTCGKCVAQPVYCPDSKFICLNGGKCVNSTVPNDSLFGFKCECPNGFYGDMCENKDSCEPNPCNANEKCVSYGNIAYKCLDRLQETTSSTTKITVPPQTRATTLTIYPKTYPQTSASFTTQSTTTTKRQVKVQNKQKNSICRDFKADICKYYAEQNLCNEDYFINGKPITEECGVSCGKC